jgi:hypothetical protein
MQNTGQLATSNITEKRHGAPVPPSAPSYRSRIQKQAHELLARQKTGAYLDNQQKRLLQRWQRLEAQKRVAEQGRAAA